MTDLKKKLKSNKGASMILVLALFMICVMVASVIMGAAASGTSRNQHRVSQQRTYLAVTSASDMVMDSFENQKFVGIASEKIYGCKDCTRSTGETNWFWLESALIPDRDNDGYKIMINPPHVDGGKRLTISGETKLDGVLGEMIYRATQDVYINGRAYEEIFSVEAAEDFEEKLPRVHGKFTMEEDYSVFVELTTMESDYTLWIEIDAEVTIGERTGETEVSCVHPVAYKKLVNGAFVNSDPSETITIQGQLNESVLTVTWKAPILSKGVVSE